MHKLKRLFFYANTDLESLRRLKPELIESNRVNLRTFTGIAFCAMLIMFILSFTEATLAPNRGAYGFSALASLLLFCVAFVGKKHSALVLVSVYIFTEMLFAFGIALGTFIRPNEMTVSFVILLFVVPLLFTDVPLRMGAAIALGILLYLPAAYITQDPLMFKMNIVDILMYGTLSIIVSSYMMTIKVRRIHLEVENTFLSKWDVLTGLMNRRSFESDLADLRSSNNRNFMLCALDVNGLKKVNDTLGHNAGDELLQGTSECIQSVFGSHGSCYRVGGDEFWVILHQTAAEADALLKAFAQMTESWHGKYIHGISVSVGIVSSSESTSLDDLLAIADKRMYDQKAAYYDTNL